MRDRHEERTQRYSTWGDKLLQHPDVLLALKQGDLRPITIQLAPNETCDSDCPFCSVADRPLKSYLPFAKIKKVLADFRTLGAKSVEITGGGNPMLYRDRISGETINDIVRFAVGIGLDVGIITNSASFKRLSADVFDLVTWVRVSLIQLDEGKNPEDYDFCGFPQAKLAFSYIIYEPCDSSPRTRSSYGGTTPDTIRRIAQLVELHPHVKFVRIAGDCLIKGGHPDVRRKFQPIVDEVDTYSRFFIKTIEDDDGPFDAACYVGGIRPYVAAAPDGNGHRVYICTSHVLQARNYNEDYALCDVDHIPETWALMSARMKSAGAPYEVRGNSGCGWATTCTHCYYKNNNRLMHAVVTRQPDGNFA